MPPARLQRARLLPTPLVAPKAMAERLLAVAEVHHQRPWQLWGPRLAACMGLRAMEIANLKPRDLEWQYGRWFLQVKWGSKGALNGARVRVIPIPHVLVAAGFVQFMHEQRGPQLFPDLRHGGNGAELNRWFRPLALSTVPGLREQTAMDLLTSACSQALHLTGMPMHYLHAFLGRTVSRAMRQATGSRCDPSLMTVFVDQADFPALGCSKG